MTLPSVETTNKMAGKEVRLKAVKLERTFSGLHVYDLHPERIFHRESHVVLWPKESAFNIQYLKHFRDCDRSDIRVVVHCTRNLFPVASLIGHRVIMQETRFMLSSLFNPRARYSSYGFDLPLAEKIFCITKWEMGIRREQKNRNILPDETEAEEILNEFGNRPILVEQEAVDWFRKHRDLFPKGAIDVELKCGRNPALLERLTNLGQSDFLGIDKTFQWNLIKKYRCSQFFLTQQLLAGLYHHWSFIGIYGAASVFNLLYPVNLLLGIDIDHLALPMCKIRARINESFYGVPAICRQIPHAEMETLADNSTLFAETVLAAIENRKRAVWPKVIVERY